MLFVMQSDRGLKTPIITQAHFQLWLKEEDWRDIEQEEAFQKCYYYKTSTLNQGIESWYGQLSKAAIY